MRSPRQVHRCGGVIATGASGFSWVCHMTTYYEILENKCLHTHHFSVCVRVSLCVCLCGATAHRKAVVLHIAVYNAVSEAMHVFPAAYSDDHHMKGMLYQKQNTLTDSA